MNGQQESQASRPSLTATKQKLNIVTVSHCEIQRATYLPSEVRLDLAPFRMRSKTTVELLQQRHDGVELLRRNLIGNGFGCCLNLFSVRDGAL